MRTWTRTLTWPAELGIRLLIAVLTPVFFVAVAVSVVVGLTELPAGVALRVGGIDVTEQDLRVQLRAMKALYGVQAPPSGDQRRDGFNRAAARSVALTAVLDQAITAHHIEITDQVARQSLDETIDRSYGPGGRDAFVKLLGNVGASEREVLAEIRRHLALARLFEVVTSTLPAVTDADLRREYDRHPDRATAQEQRHLRNIVVDDEQRAAHTAAEARAGVDFAILVSRYSLDRATRDAGGDLGPVTRDLLDDNYAREAFGATVGAVFGPVKTPQGWNVGQVVEVHAARPLSYDEAKEGLRTRLMSQRADTRWREFISDELARANVRYADKYRPEPTTGDR